MIAHGLNALVRRATSSGGLRYPVYETLGVEVCFSVSNVALEADYDGLVDPSL